VTVDNGMAIPYDALLVAAGAAPLMLDVPGAHLSGVLTFRSLQDVRAILEHLPQVQHAVIVGGGVLGLEWVQALRHHGVHVTYLLRDPRLMPRVLDEIASEIVLHQLRAAGVNILLEDEVAAFEPRRIGTAETRGAVATVGAVRTTRGKVLPCDMVGIAIGVRPNVEFLDGSGLSIDRGLLVDRFLRTNVPNVYAAGDVAHLRDAGVGMDIPPIGLWQPARAQGKVAATNMVRADAVSAYDPGAPYQATHLYDLDFAAAGLVNPPATNGVEVLAQRTQTTYRKLILRDGMLVGAVCVGDRSRTLLFKRIIDSRLNVAPIRDRLLDPQFDLPTWVREGDAASGIFQAGRLVFRVQPDAPRPSALRVALAQVPVPGLEPDRNREPARHGEGRTTRPAAVLRQGTSVFAVNPTKVTVLGRDPSCDVVLPAGSVSRRHAELSPVADGYALKDLGSANGTWVGLTRVQPGLPQPVQDGDNIRLSDLSLTFVLTGEQATGGLRGSSGDALLRGPDGTVALVQAVTRIGRSADNEVVVPALGASRLHAQIQRTDDGDLFLYDMGSRNGTLVNAALITDAHELVDGDIIDIAGITYTFSLAESSAIQAPSAELTIMAGAGVGTRYALRRGETGIGRAPWSANPIVLNDPLVSRRHATIVGDGAAFILRDAGSTGGTRVNGEGLEGPHTLMQGDVIDVGQSRLVFRIAAGRSPATTVSILGTRVPLDDTPTVILTKAGRETRGATLVMVMGSPAGLVVPLPPGQTQVIGRAGTGAVEAGTLALEDGHASRRHAQIEVAEDGKAIVQDLGSRNGTFLNGSRLAAPQALRDGDLLQIGETTLRFTLAGERSGEEFQR
jgi:pSer/pThr/pTyr-binding forkhead associated (FHA) protein/NADPH-dependent 2,4-dienoyl-CoA reductase/sulfur reductase-like enzyme